MSWHKKMHSEVAISKSGGALKEELRKNLDLIGGIHRYVKEGDQVFIKPNLTAGMPSSSGGTTDVGFTEAVVELVKEAHPSKIIVGECSGNESRSLESLINLGYLDMCKRQEIEMLDLDFADFADVPVEHPLFKDIVHLPKRFLESDVYISVPVLKTHLSAGITIALKNSFGLIPDDDKLNAHREQAIEQILVDINTIHPADLIFVDGRIGAEGIAGGNDFEHPIESGLLFVGNDPVAVDAVGTELMMQNPRVKYVQWAAEKGVGNDRLDFIQIKGLSIEEARVKFMSPADQIMKETSGKVQIYELDACSRCCSIASGPVSRYVKNPVSLLEPVDIVLGPGEWNVPEKINPRTLLLGDCVCEKYRSLGTWIGGCPVNPSEYMETLAKFDIVCAKCEAVVHKVLADYDEADLAPIRILASNKTVFQGADNKAAMDDFMLAIGNCQESYCRNHARRIHKLSDIDTSEYVVFVDGCTAKEADVKKGLETVLEMARARQRIQ